MHHLRWLVRTATSAIAIGMLSCAVVLPPSGGPEDRTPPLVEECSIPNGMLRIGSQLAIKLTFSEYVERSDIARNLSITPTAPYQLDWSGRRVTIAFDSLRPQTTYRMSIATGFRDLHGNRATEPFTLVFSTGDQLDSCQIHGLITSSVSAPLYAVLRPADSAASALEYRIPAAADGRFLADALPCLRFVVAAYADVNGTGSLEAGEPVGVAAASIQAQPPAQSPSVRIWLGYSSSRVSLKSFPAEPSVLGGFVLSSPHHWSASAVAWCSLLNLQVRVESQLQQQWPADPRRLSSSAASRSATQPATDSYSRPVLSLQIRLVLVFLTRFPSLSKVLPSPILSR